MNIVVDTNVVVSAVFFGGKPRVLLEKILLRELDAYISQEILEEYRETIDVLREKYPAKPIRVPLAQIASACKLIETKTQVGVCRDPDDDKFISCAIDSESLYIVSGDRDLLTLRQYDQIQIMTVAEFFTRVLKD